MTTRTPPPVPPAEEPAEEREVPRAIKEALWDWEDAAPGAAADEAWEALESAILAALKARRGR